MSLTFSQQNYVDKTIYHPKVKRAISSPLEYNFKIILSAIGKEGEDWFHQPPYYDETLGLVAIPDFSFPKQKLIIELDGNNHKSKKQRERDIERDLVFRTNEFYVIRIPTPIPSERRVYWKVYIQECLKICEDNLKKDKKRKNRKLFSDKEFNKELRKRINN